MTDVVDLEYVDFKNIKTRQCVQFILECDINHAHRVFDLLGYPNAGETKHVAVALLKSDRIEIPKKKFHELSPAQQAGIKANDEDFMGWLKTEKKCHDLKLYLLLDSFTDLNDKDGYRYKDWHQLMEDYVEYKRQNG